MGWSLGANDSANVFGTGVASGLIRYRVAITVTSIFVIAGALLEGSKCVGVLGKVTELSTIDAFFVLLASSVTMFFLTILALPASSSQAVIGALIGIALWNGNPDFSPLYKVLSCWVLTPIGGIFFSMLLYKPLNWLVLKCFRSFLSRNRFFTLATLLVGCYGAYCLGANNLANVTGVYIVSGFLTPFVGVLIGGLSIAFGVLTYSKKTMMTVGKSIVPLDPFSSMIAVVSEAVTLHTFTQVGVPVSSSQAIVGGVLGVGIMRDYRTVNLSVLFKILLGWVSTPLTAGVLCWFFSFIKGEIMNILEIFMYRFPVSGVETYLFLPPLVMFLASTVTSTGGISGAFLLLPFQVSVLGYTAPGVNATNFVYNIIAIPSGVYRYIRDKKFSWTLFLSLMIGTLPGVFLGYYIRLVYLPSPRRFKFFVGCVLLYLGIRTLWSGINEFRKKASQLSKPKGQIEGEKFGLRSTVIFDGKSFSFSSINVIIVSLFIGVIGGAYGIGGGALTAPYLVSVLNLPVYIVSGSALCSTWVTSILGVLIYAFGPLSTETAKASPDWLLGILFGLGGLAGTYCGAWLQQCIGSSWIKVVLGLIIFTISYSYVAPVVRGLFS